MVKDSVTTFTPAEEDQWRKTLAPVARQWAKETPNGEKVLAAFREEINAFSARKN